MNPTLGARLALRIVRNSNADIRRRGVGRVGVKSPMHCALNTSSRRRAYIHTPTNTIESRSKFAKDAVIEINDVKHAFDTAFLRDSCVCSQCVDPDSKQKLFQTSDIPLDLAGNYRLIEDDHNGRQIEFSWEKDVAGYDSNHRTRHSLKWLSRATNDQQNLEKLRYRNERVFWGNATISKINKWIDFNNWMTNDSSLHSALNHLHNYGILFLNHVPESEKSVENIASRIGHLKDTFYGRTWDVRSKPRAENIAYTPVFLGLHMDLLYTANPPHLQLLHSLRARTPGGESFFSDSFHAAETLRASSPDHFRVLCDFPVQYHYHHPTQHYRHARPTIEVAKVDMAEKHSHQIIDRVNWSPPFQGPCPTPVDGIDRPSLRDYIAASHAFEKLISSEENIYEYKLDEGECVIFDNRRVLHARRAFDATKGERWLKGAYLDNDVFFSKLRVLRERFA